MNEENTGYTSVSGGRRLTLLLAVAALVLPLHAGTEAIDPVDSIAIHLQAANDPVAERIGALLGHHIAQRSGVEIRHNGDAELNLDLAIEPGIGKEGYRIERAANRSVRIVGNDRRGLLYGVGRFMRGSRYATRAFIPNAWTGVSLPSRPVRGIYLATHFHNFYHEAPIEDVQRYLEEVALWGYNSVVVWFDMHHFQGIQDPEAQAMITRLKAIFSCAKAIGLDTGLVMIANEAYADSPERLRADQTGGHDGYTRPLYGYGVELCPSIPAGKELILKCREEVFKAFAPVAPDYISLGPYDQGGCTCSRCKPWGANGFLRISQAIADLASRYFPAAKVILSTWYFDVFTTGEWAGLTSAFAKRPEWVDYIMPDDNALRRSSSYPRLPVPGGLPLLSFPEISMFGATPWGGFGANPFPERIQRLWNRDKQVLAGGLAYSEGIYEDLNKAICGQLWWDESREASDIVREYLGYEFSPEVVEPLSEAVDILERTLPRHQETLGSRTRFIVHTSYYLLVYGTQERDLVDVAHQLIMETDRVLPDRVRRSWRWRLLYLRSFIDYELVHNDYQVSDKCEAAFRELTDLYHAEKASGYVSPPTRDKLRTAGQ